MYENIEIQFPGSYWARDMAMHSKSHRVELLVVIVRWKHLYKLVYSAPVAICGLSLADVADMRASRERVVCDVDESDLMQPTAP